MPVLSLGRLEAYAAVVTVIGVLELGQIDLGEESRHDRRGLREAPARSARSARR